MSQLQATTVNGTVNAAAAAAGPNDLTRKAEMDAALLAKADTSALPTAGTGLTQTGNIIAADFGTTASKPCAGNDARLSDARQMAPASASVDFNTHKGINLVDPSGPQDAATKAYVDARKLSDAAAPTADVPLNAHKLTGVANPTLAQDAATKAYVDARKLSDAAAPVGPVDLNSQKLTGVADPTLAQDAATKAYVDGRNLSDAAAPIADVALNAHKLTGVADPTGAQDAATKAYVDARKLSDAAAPSVDVSMASHKLTNLTDPAGAQDAATKAYVDTKAASVAVTAGTGIMLTGTVVAADFGTLGTKVCAGNDSRLSDARQMAPATGNVDFGTHKGINVVDPTGAQDAATKAYVDARKLSDAAAPTTDVSMASHKLTNVTDPVSAQDAATKNYVATFLATMIAGIGTGSPEGVVTSTQGKLFLRTYGGAGTTLYVKESGSGNTGWVGK